ncbi:MAG: hypothetical protein MUO52_10040 [Desulfobacterales bacterium]|nr:hypothetical protein [Desulfobacterales bacterium]
MLKIDYTLFIQIANFLFLLFVLNLFLFRPIRRILEQRSEKVRTFERMIAEFQNKAAQYSKELQESAAAANKEGIREKETLRSDGLDGEKGMLRVAMSSATEKIDQARKDIDNKVVEVRQSLETQLDAFSKELAEKILIRTV